MGDFEAALAQQSELEQAERDAATELRNWNGHKNEMGLLPDSVRTSPAYNAAKMEHARRFTALQQYNSRFVKQYKREYRAHVHSQRKA